MAFTREQLIQARPGFAHRMHVPFQHVDAAGIVFYARVFEYFHDAYVAFAAEAGEPLHLAIAEQRWAAPLVHAEADYLAPLRFGDQVDVQLVAARLDGSKLTVGYRIEGAGQVRAVGSTLHIFVEPSTFRRTAPPEALAQAFGRLGAP